MLNVYFTGTAGDSLCCNGMKFTTQDVDNDLYSDYHCAQEWHGAWWFRKCSGVHLNGEYLRGLHTQRWDHGIIWHQFKGYFYSYKVAEMKVAPHRN